MFKITVKNIVYLLAYALPNTILSFVIIYIINNVLGGNEDFLKDYIGIVFLSIVVYTYLLNIIFQKELNKFSFKVLYDNEKKIFRKILQVPLIKLEKLGPARFFTVVEDLRVFAMLPYTITHTVNSLLMVVLGIIYLFTLSMLSGLIVLGLIVMIGGLYFIVMNMMSKQVVALRKYNDDYYGYVDDVIKGFKKLKLSFFRADNLMNKFLIPNRDASGELDFKINYVFLSINLISQYGLYFVIAIVLFLLPGLGLLDRSDVIAYVVVILFISGPINNLINLQQTFTRFLVANKRIKLFMRDFDVDKAETQPVQLETKNSFSTIALNNVCFSYNLEEKDSSFSLGPIDLTLEKGEVIFIVGGNGSGKSTFINTITGLYTPSKGQILLDGEEKNAGKNIQNLTAAVFTDNHIFYHNYEGYEIENNEKYKKYLKLMELENVVKDDKGSSIKRKFSKGQSKRMSLIFALLEDKPILVLDEWAADQDPHFRKFFYEELIPKFKKEGKTIIAVTHDDKYFSQADRILKFDYGQIIEDIKVEEQKLHSSLFWK